MRLKSQYHVASCGEEHKSMSNVQARPLPTVLWMDCIKGILSFFGGEVIQSSGTHNQKLSRHSFF
jgi:hypothetical protein